MRICGRIFASMRMPVAVIVGEEDYATPVAMAQYLHEAIAGSTLTILKGARHLAPVESPEQVASQLLDLLQPRRRRNNNFRATRA